ncbi:MAG TPA: PAS domain-containing protein [Polyangia bacterium]|jgi:PAS domain-containing protein|nr:PAS domain-containing protein [Polyangia bacterium]
MKKPNVMRGLSDTQLLAVVESMPEGMALTDAEGHIAWANRWARQLMSLRVTTSPEDGTGTRLGQLVERLVGVLPPFRTEEYAHWSAIGGGTVEVGLRRIWAAQVAVRLSPSAEIARADHDDEPARPPSAWQLIVIERLLEEAAMGIVVANAAGHIDWMNAQAHRLLDAGTRRIGRHPQREVARAARHVATGRLRAPIRMHVDLQTRLVDAVFWNVAPGLAGVLFDVGVEEVRAPFAANG